MSNQFEKRITFKLKLHKNYDKKKRTRGKIIRRQDQRKNKRERKGERKRVTKSKTFMKRL